MQSVLRNKNSRTSSFSVSIKENCVGIIYSVVNIEYTLKSQILGSQDENIDWAIAVVQYCIFKEWVSNNNESCVTSTDYIQKE